MEGRQCPSGYGNPDSYAALARARIERRIVMLQGGSLLRFPVDRREPVVPDGHVSVRQFTHMAFVGKYRILGRCYDEFDQPLWGPAESVYLRGTDIDKLFFGFARQRYPHGRKLALVGNLMVGSRHEASPLAGYLRAIGHVTWSG